MAININHVTNEIATSDGTVILDATVIPQAEAEQGVGTARRTWTSERVRQATKAYVDPILGNVEAVLDEVLGV